jgi:SAM-dependent methyltransferase
MTDGHAAFIGSVPANYDRYLGPLLFHPYADDLAARLPVTDGMRVLEVACGTGIVSERLARRLAGRGTLVATDLNAAMIEEARARRSGSPIEWRPADGTALPFPDASFDAVVCQFGLMFFPDKAAGVREAWRVLRPGGRYLFNVWDTLERNPAIGLTHETVASFFPADPPRFYAVPTGLADAGLVRPLLDAAGFVDVACTPVETRGESPSAADAALGLIDGNPIAAAIVERRADALGEVRAALAARLAERLGDRPLRSPLRAFVWTARRP